MQGIAGRAGEVVGVAEAARVCSMGVVAAIVSRARVCSECELWNVFCAAAVGGLWV